MSPITSALLYQARSRIINNISTADQGYTYVILDGCHIDLSPAKKREFLIIRLSIKNAAEITCNFLLQKNFSLLAIINYQQNRFARLKLKSGDQSYRCHEMMAACTYATGHTC